MIVGLFADCYLPTPSGVVTSLVQLKAGLERRGHRVVVLTVANPSWKAQDATVYRFPSLPFSRHNEWRAGMARQASVNRIAARECLELIHTHTEFGLGWAGRGAAHSLHTPWVHTAHTLYEEYRHYLPFGRWLPRKAVRRYLSGFLDGSGVVVCPSQKSQRYLERCVPQAQTAVIPNAVDGSRFRAGRLTGAERGRIRSSLGVGAEDWVLLYAGRLGREKRVLELLHALVPLLRSESRCKALFVGSGTLRQMLVRTARRLGVAGQAIVVGPVEWQRMPATYAIADLFVTASQSENHPMTCLEAMASGLPVVARRDECYRDLVRNGTNGILVDSDPEIAEQAGQLLGDPARRLALAASAAAWVAGFSVEAHARRMETLYQQVLH